MKIACMVEGYRPFLNGAVVSVGTLMEHVSRRGHEVVLFAPAYPGYQDAEPGIRRLPSLKWHPTAYPCLSPLAFFRDWLGGQGFDLVHTHQPFSTARLGARLAARHDLPLVYTFHTMLNEFGVHAGRLAPLATPWLRRQYLRHCEQADFVTVGNPVVRDFLLAEGVRTPLVVVPEGVPPLSHLPGAAPRLRREWAVSAEESVLFFAGRFSREKSLDMLLRSLAVLPPATPYRLILAGGGPEEPRLRRLAEALGIAPRLHFAGWVPRERIADYYAAADLFVFPSAADAGGLVLMEAMQLGLPLCRGGSLRPQRPGALRRDRAARALRGACLRRSHPRASSTTRNYAGGWARPPARRRSSSLPRGPPTACARCTSRLSRLAVIPLWFCRRGTRARLLPARDRSENAASWAG